MTHTGDAHICASSSDLLDSSTMSNNILILYCYYEKNNNYKNNLDLFLKLGLYDDCDYLFIINGDLSIKIPEKNNIKVYLEKMKTMTLEHIMMHLIRLILANMIIIFLSIHRSEVHLFLHMLILNGTSHLLIY